MYLPFSINYAGNSLLFLPEIGVMLEKKRIYSGKLLKQSGKQNVHVKSFFKKTGMTSGERNMLFPCCPRINASKMEYTGDREK
ncbi:hypothetical protein [Methanogenium organophilum]|uniref:Uncharacterized protein n=1 Tax=Methanogenium organophilum TaxID=2199 RepID=A0A9X9S2C4_METOG|nr:hypothetical protein [Methanogenium organophilum]WAI00253.1 hypothetical protein OU421_07370 [Methanogenium organophilum]